MLGKTLYDLLKPIRSTATKLTDFVGNLVPLPSLSPGFRMMAVGIGMLVILLLMLSGCSTSSRTVRPPLPPQAQPRMIPDFAGRTHRDILLYGIEMKEGWLGCEMDKKAIRRLYGADK